jgi:hypothetical protein
MNLQLERVTLEDWKVIAEDAHFYCFQENRPKDLNTFDYALIVRNDKELCAYATIIESDKESVYMQHGGAFPNIEKGVYTARAYFTILKELKNHYKRANTKIRNTNIPMLKLAFSAGFLVNGIDLSRGEVFLHLVKEFYE